MPQRPCLMTVHAHPDDEASKGPATVARYRAQGVRTVLVCCTGGEEGDVLNPAVDKPEVRADLPAVRRRELADAARVIGYDEVVLLGYRDSGMPGSEANQRADSFAQAPLDEAVGRLVGAIRRFRPQVIIGYPEDQQGYLHPDHIRAHEVTVAAFERASDKAAYPGTGEPWQPLKLYYTMWSGRRIRAMHEKFVELGLTSPFDERWLARAEAPQRVTTVVDIAGFGHVRREALLAHATQIDPQSPFWFGLPPEVEDSIYPYDEYVLARSMVSAPVDRGEMVSAPVDRGEMGPGAAVQETDLFAGIPL